MKKPDTAKMSAVQLLAWLRAFEKENPEPDDEGWSSPAFQAFGRGVYKQLWLRVGAALGSETFNDKKKESPAEKLLRVRLAAMSLMQVIEYLQAVEQSS